MFQPVALPAASVLDRLAAQIAAEFGPAAEIRMFKRGVRKMIALGAGHPANMARYGARLALIRAGINHAAAIGCPLSPDVNLKIAINVIERFYREERRRLEVAAALGYGNRLSLMVLRELRLMLRVLRRSEFRGHLSGLVAFAVGSALEAAE